MVLGLLAGNTSLRFGLFDAGLILEWGRIEWTDLASRGPELTRLVTGKRISESVAGSVRDDLLERVGAWLPPELWPPRMARRDFAIPISNRYDPPGDVGTDRLLNALAAKSLAEGNASVAVDFGTAVSISVTAWDGAFVGGAIAAGGKTIALGLQAAAPRLPLVVPGPAKAAIQNRTLGAVQCGVYWEVAGGVRSILQGILRELGSGGADGSRKPRVLATGGEASVFAASIPEIDQVVPELTLRGLCIACSMRG